MAKYFRTPTGERWKLPDDATEEEISALVNEHFPMGSQVQPKQEQTPNMGMPWQPRTEQDIPGSMAQGAIKGLPEIMEALITIPAYAAKKLGAEKLANALPQKVLQGSLKNTPYPWELGAPPAQAIPEKAGEIIGGGNVFGKTAEAIGKIPGTKQLLESEKLWQRLIGRGIQGGETGFATSSDEHRGAGTLSGSVLFPAFEAAAPLGKATGKLISKMKSILNPKDFEEWLASRGYEGFGPEAAKENYDALATYAKNMFGKKQPEDIPYKIRELEEQALEKEGEMSGLPENPPQQFNEQIPELAEVPQKPERPTNYPEKPEITTPNIADFTGPQQQAQYSPYVEKQNREQLTSAQALEDEAYSNEIESLNRHDFSKKELDKHISDVSEHLGKGEEHDVRFAKIVWDATEKVRNRASKEFNMVKSFADQIDAKVPAGALKNVSDKFLKTLESDEESPAAKKLFEEYTGIAASKGQTVKASKIIEDMQSAGALAADAMKNASIHGITAQKRDLYYNLGKDYFNVRNSLNDLLKAHLPSEVYARQQKANETWKNEVVPLYNSTVYNDIQGGGKRQGGKVNAKLMPTLRGELPQRGDLVKVSGNKVLKDIIKKDPELLRLVVGQSFAENPEKLLEKNEQLDEYLQHMPELQEKIENMRELSKKTQAHKEEAGFHKVLSESKKTEAKRLRKEANARHAEESARVSSEQTLLNKKNATLQTKIDKYKLKIEKDNIQRKQAYDKAVKAIDDEYKESLKEIRAIRNENRAKLQDYNAKKKEHELLEKAHEKRIKKQKEVDKINKELEDIYKVLPYYQAAAEEVNLGKAEEAARNKEYEKYMSRAKLLQYALAAFGVTLVGNKVYNVGKSLLTTSHLFTSGE